MDISDLGRITLNFLAQVSHSDCSYSDTILKFSGASVKPSVTSCKCETANESWKGNRIHLLSCQTELWSQLYHPSLSLWESERGGEAIRTKLMLLHTSTRSDFSHVHTWDLFFFFFLFTNRKKANLRDLAWISTGALFCVRSCSVHTLLHPPNDWFKSCERVRDSEILNVMNVIVTPISNLSVKLF